MLHKFLQINRDEILALSEEKSRAMAGGLVSSTQLKLGLPLFYEELITVLEEKLGSPHKTMLRSAASHGNEFLKLGYSLSHVVHSYGSMCQAITELATMKDADISPHEFNILNGCLDVSIASAVSEYQFRSNAANEVREVKHLGFLAHELRNALSSATIAQEMIRAGIVGVGGSTASVLEVNLVRMRNLIDRSLSEVRMRSDSDLHVEKFRLSDLIEQIAITSKSEAAKKQQKVILEVDSQVEMAADRQLLLSAIANLLQNAIKYSKSSTSLLLRAHLRAGRITIEIQDQCGGIKGGKVDTLFEPYVQANADRTGMGLGLSIARHAIELNQGTIIVVNNPGIGCSFIIEMPQNVIVPPTNKKTVPGEDAVQPDFKPGK